MKSFSERKKEKETKAEVNALQESGTVTNVTVKNVKESWLDRALPFILLLIGSLIIIAEILFNLNLIIVGVTCGLWILTGIWIIR